MKDGFHWIERKATNMFMWKDYDGNSALFIKGIDGNVAILRQKDFQLTDSLTRCKTKIKAGGLEDAKEKAEKYLEKYWSDVAEEYKKYLQGLIQRENIES